MELLIFHWKDRTKSENLVKRRFSRANSIAVASAAGAFLIASAIPLISGNASAASSSASLTIAVQNVPATLDPALSDNGGNNVTFASLAYDSLIYLAPSGAYEPDLATSWKYVGSNNEEFVVQLRSGVQFSDGSTLTAQDVVNSIKYAQASGSTASSFLTSLASISATGPLTVQMNFSSPRPDLQTIFDQNLLAGDIIGPSGLATSKGLGTSTDGTGPYMLDASKSVTGSSYVYDQNPNYWNSSLDQYSSITVSVISDPTAGLDAVKSGQVNFMFGGSATQAKSAQSAGLKVYAAPYGWTALFIDDYTGKLVKALGNEKVRQAISYVTNRPVLANALYGQYAIPNDETTLPGSTGYDPAYSNFYKYNLAKAKKLMAEAGYPHGFVFPIVATPVQNIETTVEALSSELSQIGIKMKIHVDATFTEEIGDWLAKKYPAVLGAYGTLPMSIESPELYPKTAIFNPFKDAANPLIFKYTNEADKLGGAAADTLYQKVEVTALKEAYEDVLFGSDSIYFAQPGKIGNLQIGKSYPGSDFAPDVAFFSPPQS